VLRHSWDSSPIGNELARRGGKWGQAIRRKLTAVLVKAGANLYTEDEILCLVQPVLTDHELERLRKHLWRGTLAAIAYDWIRSQLVHTTGGSNEVTFDKTTFRGGPVPPINFTLLYGSISNILQAMEELSLTSGKLYGHDFPSPPEFTEGGVEDD